MKKPIIELTETEIQRQCLDYLSARGIFSWRNNTAGIYSKKAGCYIFHGLKGVSDILGIHKGKFLAIEVKRPKKEPTDLQQEFLNNVDERGGIGMCVHSVEELEEDLKEAGLI